MKHPDSAVLKNMSFQNIKEMVKDFLIINEKYVTLKNNCGSTTNECDSLISDKGTYSH